MSVDETRRTDRFETSPRLCCHRSADIPVLTANSGVEQNRMAPGTGIVSLDPSNTAPVLSTFDRMKTV